MIIQEKKLSDIVMENTHAAVVFEKFGLDYCCHGNIKLCDACKIKFIDSEEIVRELSTSQHTENKSDDPLHSASEWKIPELIDYIKENHHTYVKEVIPVISSHLEKCVESHGARYPMLAKAQIVFEKIISDLQAHMMKEEKILFPSLVLMADCLEKNQPVGIMPFSAVTNPIDIMRFEHEIAGNEMVKMHEILNDFTLPDGACTTMQLTFKELGEFEHDLHRHVFLENFVLFPKAEKMERELAIAAGE